jgi:3-hydroxyacyl-CoA dehydrogenase
MASRIRKVAVIGAGTMGSGIAAHVANAGLPCVLLDIVPPKLSEEERKDKAKRDRFAAEAIQKAIKAKPPMLPFHTSRFAKRVVTGNLEDDLELLRDCDLIIEAIVEDLKIKRDLYAKLAELRKPDAIVSSNTSGIAINSLVEGFDEGFQKHFLVTHFFNPPRFMKLLELVPGEKTDRAVMADVAEFGEHVLGKGIVYGKDTPNFIANRIGVMGMGKIFQLMEQHGLTVEEVDAITGPAMARPKSATYGTADLVGLDVLDHIFRNSYESMANDETRELLKAPAWFTTLVKGGALGNKTKKGFYTRDGKTKLYYDWKTGGYKETVKPKWKSTDAAKKGETAADKIRALHAGDDNAAAFAWDLTASLFAYCGAHLDEIADDIVNIDNAMKWGYNWELGPFEIWDAIGLKAGIDKMTEKGLKVPAMAMELAEKGEGTWYVKRGGVKHFWDHKARAYTPMRVPPTAFDLAALREGGKELKRNDSASIIDLGDGVLCVEFHSKMNAIDDAIILMIHEALDIVEGGEKYAGLVLGNQGENFSVGANLFMILMYARQKKFADLEKAVRGLQTASQRLRYSSKPTVAAPFGMALGGGCEVCLGCDAICAHSELYMGLVEIGAGVIPAGGGTKNTLARWLEHVPADMAVDRFPYIQKAFELIGMATVSFSAEMARDNKHLRLTDRVVLNRDEQLNEAKKMVIGMYAGGYKPPTPPDTLVLPGAPGLATFKMGLHNMKLGKFITEYEFHIASKLAKVLTGGDIEPWSQVTEQHVLDLECEAFMSLVGEAKTQERMQNLLMKGKPLRN